MLDIKQESTYAFQLIGSPERIGSFVESVRHLLCQQSSTSSNIDQAKFHICFRDTVQEKDITLLLDTWRNQPEELSWLPVPINYKVVREMVDYLFSDLHIGYEILPETKVMTKQYEVAAWYRKIEVKAGKYPIKLHKVKYNKEKKRIENNQDGYNPVTIMYHGTVVGSDFTSLFGGNRIGEGKIDKDLGEEDNVYLPLYSYQFADFVNSQFRDGHKLDNKCLIELDPKWKVEWTTMMLPRVSDILPERPHIRSVIYRELTKEEIRLLDILMG